MTSLLLRGLRQSGRLAAHVDSRDVRPAPTINRFDIGKAALSLRLVGRAARQLLRHRRAALYLPISQSRWALVRDGVLLVIARTMRRPRIIHLHGGMLGPFLGRHPLLRGLLRLGSGGATYGWVLTNGLRPQLADLIQPGAIDVLSNAVPDPGPPNKVASGPRNSTNILYLSNFFPGKGQELFLSALSYLVDRQSQIHIRLAGGGEEARIEKAVAQLRDLRDAGWDITYDGSMSTPESRRALAWADILVMTPQQTEGQPLVILEAMAAGCAVIASNRGGIAETVEDGVEGRVVDADPIEIAHAIREMLDDEEDLQGAQLAARKRYATEFTEEKFVRQLTVLIHRLDSPEPQAPTRDRFTDRPPR